jgi:hypothetical protein
VELCCVVATLAISALFVRALDARNASAKGGYRKAKQSTGDASEMELNKSMTENREMDELNVWIFKNVFGWMDYQEEEFPHRTGFAKGDEFGEKMLRCDMPDFTTDRAAAMEVWCACQKKLGAIPIICSYQTEVGGYWIRAVPKNGTEVEGISETFERACANFARQLFPPKEGK